MLSWDKGRGINCQGHTPAARGSGRLTPPDPRLWRTHLRGHTPHPRGQTPQLGTHPRKKEKLVLVVVMQKPETSSTLLLLEVQIVSCQPATNLANTSSLMCWRFCCVGRNVQMYSANLRTGNGYPCPLNSAPCTRNRAQYLTCVRDRTSVPVRRGHISYC